MFEILLIPVFLSAHPVATFRHIILLVVDDVVKHVLKPVQLLFVKYTDGVNGDVLRCSQFVSDMVPSPSAPTEWR